MLQATGKQNLVPQLEELETASADQRNHLQSLIRHIESRPAAIESFFAGSRETRALREAAWAASSKGDLDHASTLINSYLVL